MSRLERVARERGVVPSNDLDAALQRQRIYGGSLDTLLYEQNLIDDQALIDLLEAASGLSLAPNALLLQESGHPFDLLPVALLETGWAAPLGTHQRRYCIACHPEIPEDARAAVLGVLPDADLRVVPECLLARLTGMRARSIVPQRYDLLANRFLQFIRRSNSGPLPVAVGLPAAAAAPSPNDRAATVMGIPAPAGLPPITPAQPPAPSAPSPDDRANTVMGIPAPAGPDAPGTDATNTTDTTEPGRAATVMGIPSAFGLTPPAAVASPGLPSFAPPSPSAPTPSAPTPSAPTPSAPTPSAPTPSAPTPPAPTPSAPTASPPTPSAPTASARPEGLSIPSLLKPEDDIKRTLLGGLPNVPTSNAGGPAVPAPSMPSTSSPVPSAPGGPAASAPGHPVATSTEADDEALRVQALALAEAHRTLAATTQRDEITSALAAAVATQCERVVLFSVRKAGLVGLEVPNTLECAHNVTIPMGGELGKAVAGQRPLELARDLDLRMAVRLERAAPCVFEPLRVQERTVLVIYADQGGAPIDGAARANIKALVETAAERLLDVLLRRRAGATPPSPAAPTPSTPAAPTEEASAPPRPEGRARIEMGAETEAPRDDAAPIASSVADFDGDLDTLVASVIRGEAPVELLLEAGPPALQQMMASFPGTLTVDAKDRSAVTSPGAHGPLLRVCIAVGAPVVDDLIAYLASTHERTRMYAAFCFQELRDARCVTALPGLAFDSSADVRSVAMRVLETYGDVEGFDEALAEVRGELYASNITRTLHAVQAAGVLRDVIVIPRLIELLAKKDPYLHDSLVEALCTITAQQLGTKPHRWKNWYHDHGARPRVQWLISALSHRDRNVRAWSGEELRRITGAAIVFPVDGDRGQREAAIRQWAQWWDRERQRKFQR